VTDEPGYVAFGGQADQVSAALKERYSPGMSLSEAFAAALAALSAPGNGEGNDVPVTQLEVAVLDRTRDHRTFRRIRAARLEELISQSREADTKTSQAPEAPAEPETQAAPGTPPAPGTPAGPGPASGSDTPVGPDASGTDRGGGLGDGDNPSSPL
jgi:proteasome alpha subunit